jgi:hypothetical protein
VDTTSINKENEPGIALERIGELLLWSVVVLCYVICFYFVTLKLLVPNPASAELKAARKISSSVSLR